MNLKTSQTIFKISILIFLILGLFLIIAGGIGKMILTTEPVEDIELYKSKKMK